MGGSIEHLEGRPKGRGGSSDRMPALQKSKSGPGIFPAAAAAPTDPSFRDTQLKRQSPEISKKNFPGRPGKSLANRTLAQACDQGAA